jgi:hypothetical protein
VQRELDALLFTADGWFTIDAGNRKVAGVTPATLDQALVLVGQGPVAPVVGRLRAEVVGVDVDAAGALGDTAAQTLRDWCTARRLWHLLRASGGGPGRWHVLIVPGVHRDDLAVLLDQLRRELRLTGRQLDLRTQLRPLTAPHRRRGATPPPDGLEHALTDLRSVLQPAPARVLVRRRSTGTQQRLRDQSAAGGPEAPLRPLPRPRRELPAPWAAYLTRGRRAAAVVDRDPATRSQLELTSALIRAGYSEPDAWTAINTAHRSAFSKAVSAAAAGGGTSGTAACSRPTAGSPLAAAPPPPPPRQSRTCAVAASYGGDDADRPRSRGHRVSLASGRPRPVRLTPGPGGPDGQSRAHTCLPLGVRWLPQPRARLATMNMPRPFSPAGSASAARSGRT